MGTSIVLNDVVFSNKNLPVVAELVTDGLVSAFRPTLSKDSLFDLSGNGVQATIIGNPTFHDGYISGFFQNGFRIEAAETESATLMCVFRVARNNMRNSNQATPVGSRFASNGGRGSCIFASTPTNSLNIFQNYAAWVKQGSTTNVAFAANGAKLHTLASAVDENPSDFIFIALTIDANSNNFIQYFPKGKVAASSTTEGTTIKDRPLVNKANGQMSRFEVCSAAGDAGALATCDVAEVLIYNKALTEAQIYEQYELSKKFFERNRAISI